MLATPSSQPSSKLGRVLDAARPGSPPRSATSTRRAVLEELARADDEHDVAATGDGPHGVLAVLGGVADVVGLGPDDHAGTGARRAPR